MSSIKPDDGGGEIHSAKEGFGAFIVSGGDGAVLFEFGEEILDQMSGFVQFFIVCTRLFPVFLWRDDALRLPFSTDQERAPARHRLCRPEMPACLCRRSGSKASVPSRSCACPGVR